MNIQIKERFLEAWEKYFPGSELPIACYYARTEIRPAQGGPGRLGPFSTDPL